jgi:hypothetical protein
MNNHNIINILNVRHWPFSFLRSAGNRCGQIVKIVAHWRHPFLAVIPFLGHHHA